MFIIKLMLKVNMHIGLVAIIQLVKKISSELN